MRRIAVLILAACLLCATMPAVAQDVNFVTAGTQGTFYAISVTLAQLWNETIPGIRVTATPSGGGVDNLNQAYDGEAQIGVANANLVYQAMMGIDAFTGYPNDNIRIFAGLYYNPNQVVVTKASGIKDLCGLAGKRFSVGAIGSTTIEEAERHLAAQGLTLDDLRTEYMDVSSSADGIQNRQLDGVWIMAGIPNAGVSQIMIASDAKLIPISDETLATLQEKYPWYARCVIPAGTYDHQSEDVPTTAVKLTIFVTGDLDNEIVYQMTKAFWDNWRMLTDNYPALRMADPMQACMDLAGVPLHDGAARYYREIGLIE